PGQHQRRDVAVDRVVETIRRGRDAEVRARGRGEQQQGGRGRVLDRHPRVVAVVDEFGAVEAVDRGGLRCRELVDEVDPLDGELIDYRTTRARLQQLDDRRQLRDQVGVVQREKQARRRV